MSFLSDYGHADEFVGVVTSVLARLAPQAMVVELSHEVAAHDVRAGGLLLRRAAPWLAPGVVLAVVDPGVGTSRRAVAVEAEAAVARSREAAWPRRGVPGPDRLVFVGPDNGLLSPALDLLGGARRAVLLERPGRWHPLADLGAGRRGGPTFDGRDLFAPAAAALCNGAELADLGPPVDPAALVPGPLTRHRATPGQVETEVLWVDRFGNAQLGAGPADLAGSGPVVEVEVQAPDPTARPGPPGLGWSGVSAAGPVGPTRAEATRAEATRAEAIRADATRAEATRSEAAVRADATRVRAFAELAPGQLGLMVDSTGLLALVLDRGPAAARLGVAAGDPVVLRWAVPASGTAPTRPAPSPTRPGPGPDPVAPPDRATSSPTRPGPPPDLAGSR